MCSPVLWGCHWKVVWSPVGQQCQCPVVSAHGWWRLSSWRHQLVVVRQSGQGTWFWHSSLPAAGLAEYYYYYFFLFIFFLPGAGITVCFSVVSLSSKHPLKQADCGGSATYWLGAAQLKAGVSWPVGHNDPSHRRRQPVAPELTPIHSGLITRNCRLPCCVVAGTAALEWPLQGASLGKVCGDPGMPSRQDPPLGLTYVVQRNAEQYVWHQLGCRSCRNSAWIQAAVRLRGSTPDLEGLLPNTRPLDQSRISSAL